MPSTSEKQRRYMGMELAKQRATGHNDTGMSVKQLGEFAGSVKHHSPIEGPEPLTHTGYGHQYEVVRTADPCGSQAVDRQSYGRDWDVLKLDERIFHTDPDTPEDYDIENGVFSHPGERLSRQD